jgi:hypothetical protein
MDEDMVVAVRSDSDKKLLRSKHGKTLKSFFLSVRYEYSIKLTQSGTAEHPFFEAVIIRY